MSGYGLAADSSGDVYFVTGNSDLSGTTYNGVTNVQESVVKVSSDLTQLLSIFTPSDVGYLDEGDVDSDRAARFCSRRSVRRCPR